MFFQGNINEIHNSVTECGEVLIRIEESFSTNCEIIVNMDGVEYILDENNDLRIFSEHGDIYSICPVTDTPSMIPCNLKTVFQSLFFQGNNNCDFFEDALTCTFTYAEKQQISELKLKVSQISQKYHIVDRLKSAKENNIVMDNNPAIHVREKIQDNFFQLCFEADKELVVHNEGSRVCPICKKVFATSRNTEKHVFYCHTAPRPYQCKCKKSFVELRKLQFHVQHFKNSDLHGIMNSK